jgi:hypothetical protein
MRGQPRFWCATALIALLAACGGDPTGTNSGDQLTNEEIQALFNVMGQAFSGIGVASPEMAGGAAAVPVNESIDVSVPCASGGTIDVSGSLNGSIDETTFDSDLSMDVKWVFHGCLVTTAANTLTVDGDPEINFDAHIVFTQTDMSMDGSEVGGLKFTTSDDRAGSCALDIDFSTTINFGDNSYSNTLSGSVCGVSASSFEAFTQA